MEEYLLAFLHKVDLFSSDGEYVLIEIKKSI